MIASYTGMGDVMLNLIRDDAKILNDKRRLECTVNGYSHIARIQVVNGKLEKAGYFCMEEEGFRVITYPLGCSFEDRKLVVISINNERLQQLNDTGYIATRWGNGIRIDITNLIHDF